MTGRVAGGALVAATILAATIAAGAGPAGAEDPGPGTRGPIDHSGSRTGDGYTAAAALLSVDGPGSSGGDLPAECVVPTRPDEPAHVGRLYSGPRADGSYLVLIYCDVDGPFPYQDPTFSVTYFAGFVTPLDPAELVENALANLHLDRAVIQTNPGDGVNSLTGLATHLWIDRLSLRPQSRFDDAGPLRVEITATPSVDGRITWDTGEDTVTCANYGEPEGSCSYTYQRSSLGQPGDQYAITASVTYTGSYTVRLNGAVYRGPIDIGDVVVPTEPYLLGVAEAQALNTNG